MNARFQLKFIAFVLCLPLLILVLVYMGYLHQKSIIEDEFNHKSRSILAFLTSNSEFHITSFDWPQLEEIQKQALAQPGILAVWIEDTLSERRFGEQVEQISTQGKHYSQQIVADNQTIGSVHIVFDLTRHRQVIKSIELFCAISTLIIVLFVLTLIIMRSRQLKQQKSNETSLLKSEARFMQFADVASDWFWEMDSSLRFSFFSSRFEEISGVHSDHLLGKTRRETGVLGIDQKIWNDHLQTLDAHKPFLNFVHSRLKENGEVWLSISGQPVFDEAGVFRGYRGIGTDISAAKKIELELINAKESAEKSNKAKTAFLSSMSHELRTPMNAILGFGQMLEFNIEEPLTKEQKICVDHIMSSGQHLLELIDQTLDLAKIEAGKMNISIEKIQLNIAIQECLVLIDQSARDRGLEISSDLGSAHTIKVDYIRFKQVLLNLLSNAVKYNRERGSIVLTTRDTPGGMVRISVTDNGMGIADDEQGQLFEPFNRLGKEASNIEGTGVGLTITKELVEIMDGHIGHKSTVGKGSTFWVDFPAIEITAVKYIEMGKSPINDEPHNQFTIAATVLYIEDHPANQQLMEMILRQVEGVSLHMAHTAEIGIETAQQLLPDLILMDINLPGMNGIEALKYLRNNPKTQKIPVVAVSANALPHDLAVSRQAGFEAYITKPFNIQDVITTISQKLGPVARTNEKATRTGQKTEHTKKYAPLREDDVRRLFAATEALPPEYISVLKSQAESLPFLIAKIQHAVSAGKNFEAENFAHTLKTNSATFGVRDMWSQAQNVEEMARNGDLSDVPKIVADMEDGHEIISPLIERLLDDLETSANKCRN